MRAALPVCLLVVLTMAFMPSGSATEPLLPGMSTTLAPTAATVNFTANQTVMVKFNGTVKVSQNAVSSMSVTITNAVDVGWAATSNPSTMSFKGSGTQSFLCTVTVPSNATNGTGVLTVTVRGVTHFLQVTNTARANIQVMGLNNTTANQTKHTTGGGGGTASKAGGMNMILIAAVVIVVVVIGAVGGFFFLRRRKSRRLEMEAAEAQASEAEAAAQPL